MLSDDPIALDLAYDRGALTLGPDGDLAFIGGVPALQQGLQLRMITTPGSVPYFPDDGGGAAAAEGGPALDGGALARRTRTQCLRDEDVASVREILVSTDNTGLAIVSVQVSTRAAPHATQTLQLPLPVT